MPARDALRLLVTLLDYAAGDVSADIKPMHGDKTGWRLRSGDWRLIFDRDGDTLIVRRAGHRREIYR